MSTCPRCRQQPSRRVLAATGDHPPLCLPCKMGGGARGQYRTADRSEAARRGNATRRRQQAEDIEARFQAALERLRWRRRVA